MDAVAKETCAYHAMYPATGDGAAKGTAAAVPALAEVEKGHFVACFRLDEPGTC